MNKGLILQERDVELLKFLADYKIITLDNTKYVYGRKTYHEKRISRLVKEKYLIRLKPKEITLGRKGRKFLIEIGIEIKEHCRNENNIERLKIISDIAAFTHFSSSMSFIPSWKFKDEDSLTQYPRRYLGFLTFDQAMYNVYSVYGEKGDKYITSIHYDLKKARDSYAIIFTNNIEKILYHKKSLGEGDKHLYLIEYNEFNKRIIRNYDNIRTFMFNHLCKKHKVEYTNYRYMDFFVDNKDYLKIVLFLDLNQLYALKYILQICNDFKEHTYFICFKKHEKYIKEIIKDCQTLIIEEATLEEYIAQNCIENNDFKFRYYSE